MTKNTQTLSGTQLALRCFVGWLVGWFAFFFHLFASFLGRLAGWLAGWMRDRLAPGPWISDRVGRDATVRELDEKQGGYDDNILVFRELRDESRQVE